MLINTSEYFTILKDIKTRIQTLIYQIQILPKQIIDICRGGKLPPAGVGEAICLPMAADCRPCNEL